MLVAMPVITPGVAPDPRDATIVTDVGQLPALLATHPLIRLYGEHEGVVFTGDAIDRARLESLRFWWSARTC